MATCSFGGEFVGRALDPIEQSVDAAELLEQAGELLAQEFQGHPSALQR
jgi:hypothetical protein